MQPDSPREKLAAVLRDLNDEPNEFLYDRDQNGPSLTIGDLRALLAEPTPVIAIPISDALRSMGSHKWTGCQSGGSPSDAGSYEWVRHCEICGMEDTCEDPLPPCPGDDTLPSDALRQVEAAIETCQNYLSALYPYSRTEGDAMDLAALVSLCRDALKVLPALAQQMVEGEQRRVFLIDLQRRLDAVAPLIEQQRDDLVRTREALAVAEENLESAAISLASYDQSYGGGGGESEALDIARSLGFDGGSNECVEWLLDRCKLRAARIAALSPTGTPGAEKGSTK